MKKHTHNDGGLFADAMRDVTPIPPGKRHEVPTARKGVPPVVIPSAPLRNIEDDGISDYVGDGQARTVIRRIKRTRIDPEDQLDLHGHTSATVDGALDAFIRSRQDGREQRAVLVIHGQGHRSADRRPILKLRTRLWLKSSTAVLAFTSEGPGALRVLLKRSAG